MSTYFASANRVWKAAPRAFSTAATGLDSCSLGRASGITQTVHVYVDYIDGGYYLYNPYYRDRAS